MIFVKINDLVGENKIEYGERRLIERDLGMHIEGEADVRNPERVFGIVPLGGRWYFGHYVESEPVWYHHIKKNHIVIPHLLAHVLRDQLQISRCQIQREYEQLTRAVVLEQ